MYEIWYGKLNGQMSDDWTKHRSHSDPNIFKKQMKLQRSEPVYQRYWAIFDNCTLIENAEILSKFKKLSKRVVKVGYQGNIP